MPSQGNIDAARQCSDAARTATVGLSLEEGAAAPVAAMGTTNTNLFAASFGEFAGRYTYILLTSYVYYESCTTKFFR